MIIKFHGTNVMLFLMCHFSWQNSRRLSAADGFYASWSVLLESSQLSTERWCIFYKRVHHRILLTSKRYHKGHKQTNSPTFLWHFSMSSLSFSFQIKTQITLLFRGHTDLLEEFWEFFKQLYPQVQDEDHADNVSNVETNQGLEESQSYQPIRIVIPDKKVEPVKTANKHRRKRDKHAQVPHKETISSYHFSYIFNVYRDLKPPELCSP